MGTEDATEIFYSFTDGIYHEGKAEKLEELVGIRGVRTATSWWMRPPVRC